MSDAVYQKFVKRWEEVTDLPPQTMGPFTPYYKTIVRRLKVMPWPMFVAIGVIGVMGVYFLIGSTITLLVSILQKGF